MFQTIKNKIDNYITKTAKSILEEKKPQKLDFVDSEDILTPEQAQKLLALSFQRTPDKSFRIAHPGGKTVAMDSVCGCNIPKPYGLEGVGRNIIYTFFSKHGFIGWQLCALLAQHWLVHRACTIPNQDAMAPGWENVFEKEDKEQDEQILMDLYQKSEQKYRVTKKCVDFGNNRKIFGIGIAFPIIEGVDPSLPFNIDAVKPGSYKGIAIIDPYWCLPSWTQASMSEPGNLHFYKPEYYSFPFNGGIQKVHRSNLIISTHGEVPDILKPSYYFGGIPLPQMMYERVYAAEKVANEAPLLALTKRLLVADANLEQLYTDPENSKKKIDRLVKMRDNFGVWCKQPGDQFTQIDTSLADFDALIMTQYQIVAGIVDVPMFKLMGSNFKGLNPTGEGELKNYVQTLQSLQENVFKPLIERHNLLCMKSDFNMAKMVSVKFKPVDMPTEKELAEVEALKAQTDTAYVNSGILTPEEVRAKVAADTSNSYNSLSDELPEELDLEEDAFNTERAPFEQINIEDSALDANWKESDHPRDDDGKFKNVGGSGISGKSAQRPAPRQDYIPLFTYKQGSGMSVNAQSAYADGLLDENQINEELSKISPKSNDKEREALKRYFYSEWHHVGKPTKKGEEPAHMNFYDTARFVFGDHLKEYVKKLEPESKEDLEEFAKKYDNDDPVDLQKLGKLLVERQEKIYAANKQYENNLQVARAEKNKKVAGKIDFSPAEIEDILNGVNKEYNEALKAGRILPGEKLADVTFTKNGKKESIKNAYIALNPKDFSKYDIYDKKGGQLLATRGSFYIKMQNLRNTREMEHIEQTAKEKKHKAYSALREVLLESADPKVRKFLENGKGFSFSRSGNVYVRGEIPGFLEGPKEGQHRLREHQEGGAANGFILQEYKDGNWKDITSAPKEKILLSTSDLKNLQDVLKDKNFTQDEINIERQRTGRLIGLDDKWITIHPPHGNKEHTGIPIKIDESGQIKAGAGGVFNGKNINNLKKDKTEQKNNAQNSTSYAKPRIKHKKLGEGTMEEQFGNKVSIKFDNGSTRIFSISEGEDLPFEILSGAEQINKAAASKETQAIKTETPAEQTLQPDEEGRVYINVPYSEKDEVKKLGGRWDSEKKSWYIPKGVNNEDFIYWIRNTIYENGQHLTPLPKATETNKELTDGFKAIKETEKAYLLEKEGTQFWVQKRWVRNDGTLTGAGLKNYESAKNEKVKEEADKERRKERDAYLEQNGVSFKPNWTGENAYGVDIYYSFVRADGEESGKKIRVFIPKKTILPNGNAPYWLVQAKMKEAYEKASELAARYDANTYQEFNGFTGLEKAEEKFKLEDYISKKANDSLSLTTFDELYTVLGDVIYEIK